MTEIQTIEGGQERCLLTRADHIIKKKTSLSVEERIENLEYDFGDFLVAVGDLSRVKAEQ